MGFFTGKKVLVTGGAGLCGHGIISRALDEGAYVRATTHRQLMNIENPNLRNLHVMQCNLLDYNQCLEAANGMDIIFHAASSTAGAAGQTKSNVVAKLVRESVTLGTNMMSAAVESNVARFGFIGSSTMYPDVPYPVSEEAGFVGDPWKGYMGVGWMKRYLEKAAQFYSLIGTTQFALARTVAVYGPYDHFDLERGHVIPALVLKFIQGMNPLEVWGDGEDVRNFIYVDDLVDGLFLLVEHAKNCDPYNVATTENSTVNDVIRALEKATGFHPEIKYDNTKPSMIPYRTVNVEKMDSVFGWRAKTSLEEGIAKTVDWYKRRLL